VSAKAYNARPYAFLSIPDRFGAEYLTATGRGAVDVLIILQTVLIIPMRYSDEVLGWWEVGKLD
jgi:hypothetical protein